MKARKIKVRRISRERELKTDSFSISCFSFFKSTIRIDIQDAIRVVHGDFLDISR